MILCPFWLLVQMPPASGTVAINDLNRKLGWETNNFTQNLIAERMRNILHFIEDTLSAR